jgi:hypothetical protein
MSDICKVANAVQAKDHVVWIPLDMAPRFGITLHL